MIVIIRHMGGIEWAGTNSVCVCAPGQTALDDSRCFSFRTRFPECLFRLLLEVSGISNHVMVCQVACRHSPGFSKASTPDNAYQSVGM